MFLQHNSPALHNYNIMPNLCKPSDHAPLTVELSIYEENNQSVINILVEDSDEETNFLRDLIYVLSSTDTINITNTTDLENTVNMFARALEELWGQYSKYPNITRHSKQWWNTECTSSIVYYWQTGRPQDWTTFKKMVKAAKQSYFDEKIQEIASFKKRPWDLMNWVRKRKLPATKAIQYNKKPCTDLDSLWNALYSFYNATQNRPINPSILKEIPNIPTIQ